MCWGQRVMLVSSTLVSQVCGFVGLTQTCLPDSPCLNHLISASLHTYKYSGFLVEAPEVIPHLSNIPSVVPLPVCPQIPFSRFLSHVVMHSALGTEVENPSLLPLHPTMQCLLHMLKKVNRIGNYAGTFA